MLSQVNVKALVTSTARLITDTLTTEAAADTEAGTVQNRTDVLTRIASTNSEPNRRCTRWWSKATCCRLAVESVISTRVPPVVGPNVAEMVVGCRSEKNVKASTVVEE